MLKTIECYEIGYGLPYPIMLLNAAEELVDDTGESVGVRIPDLEGLCAAIAIIRSLHRAKLNGAEVRFMRRTLDMTQQELADALELSDKSVISRWEHDCKEVVAGYVEKLLRTLVVIQLRDKAPGLSVSEKDIVQLRIGEGLPPPRLEFKRVRTSHNGKNALEWDLRVEA